MSKKLNLVIGTVLILFGLGIVGKTFLPVVTNEIRYQISQKSNMPKVEIEPINTDFAIVIPKINANAPIIANVDPFDPTIYQTALKRGVAHAKGSGLPKSDKNIFLFSHSSADFLTASKYNSIFYLISKLEKGDIVKIYYRQELLEYQVSESKIVSPKSISYLNPEAKEEILTLMTCWPPGTTVNR